MTENDDIREVMEEEKRRGRRPLDAAAREGRRKLLRAYAQLLYEPSEARFRESIAKIGILEGSDAFAAALEAWRDAQKREKT